MQRTRVQEDNGKFTRILQLKEDTSLAQGGTMEVAGIIKFGYVFERNLLCNFWNLLAFLCNDESPSLAYQV